MKIILTFLILCAGYAATAISLPDHEFTLTLPDGWEITQSPKGQSTAVRNFNGEPVVITLASQALITDMQFLVPAMKDGIRKNPQLKGGISERRLKIAGCSAVLLTYHGKDGLQFRQYAFLRNDRVWVLLFSGRPDILRAAEPQISEILKNASFSGK